MKQKAKRYRLKKADGGGWEVVDVFTGLNIHIDHRLISSMHDDCADDLVAFLNRGSWGVVEVFG